MVNGKWRVYFNAKEEWPLVWSVDDGDPETETKFASVTIHGRAVTVYNKDTSLPAQPMAWIEVEGKLEIGNNAQAVIWGAVHVRQAR